MTRTLAATVARRAREAGYTDVLVLCVPDVDRWYVSISGKVIGSPEQWTALAAERGAAGVGTMYAKG